VTRTLSNGWTWFVLILLNLPIFVVVVVSFSPTRYMDFPPASLSLQWYADFFMSQNWRTAMLNSFIVALGAVIIATPLGVLAAIGLVRGKFMGKGVVSALVGAPMVLPSIVAAVGMYFFFARIGMIGNRLSLILAHAALTMPVVVISVSAVLVNFDEDLEKAARNLGANRIRTFRHITWPLIQPAVLSGMLFAFLMSFDELTVALFLAGLGGETLPVRMWSAMKDEISPTIAAVSTLLIVLSIVVIAATQLAQWLAARRAEQ
jgi:putative spermidine/putrescine transport system permease protein